MRLCVFNCLLLASVAIASPNDRHKRDLAYLKNLISSAFFGRSQINIQPEPVLQEEVGYKLFRIPGYEDVMIKVSPKKPVVEEFVYPSVEKVNLNAFGTVVGTKRKDETLGAVKEVDNLLSSGILYGGHHNVMKENVVPMFPAMNAGNYVVEKRIKTAPVVAEKEVLENRPIYEEVIETKSKPVLTKMIENRPAFKKVISKRPVYEEVIKERPVFKEVSERRPFYEEIIETKSKPVFTEVIEKRPKFKEVIESRPAFKEVIETRPRPIVTEVIEKGPIFQEVIEKRPKPVVTKFIGNRPAFAQVLEKRPSFTEVLENRPVLEEVIETGPRQILTEVKSRPVQTEVIEIRPKPVLTEVIETRPEPVFSEVIESRPVLTEVVEEKVEIKEPFEPTYSYKQMKHNEPVMTYTAHTSPGVDVLENIKMKTELPMCIKKRVDEAIVLGSDPTRFAPVQEVFQYQNTPVFDFSYPKVEANSYVDELFRGDILTKEFGYQNPPVFEFSYPKVEENSYVQGSFRAGEVLTEEFDSFSGYELIPQRFKPSFQDRPERYNLRPTKTKAINPHPVPLNFHKPLHFEEDISATKDKISAKKDDVKENSQTKKVQVFSNLGEKVDIAKTLGPIPSQYNTNVNNKTRNAAASIDKSKQMKAVPIVASKDNVSNAKIPNSVYRLQMNPNTGESLKENSFLRTNVNPTTTAPVVTAEKDDAQERKVVYTNKVTAKPQTIKRPVKIDSANVHKISSLREYIQNSAINKQIVAKEAKSYTYRQKNADGSSLNVNGNKHGVSVDVKDKGRGDIPDQ